MTFSTGSVPFSIDSPDAPPDSSAPPAQEGAEAPVRRRRRVEPLLLECAYEVCNQMGGIYTVLRSKTPSMVSRWGNRYCLVGPYNPQTAQVEFEPAPLVGAIGNAVRRMREAGFEVHFGRWLVSGRPHVVLLDHLSAFHYLHQVKARLWRDHGIPTPSEDELINNVVAFGEVTRVFLRFLAEGESHRRQIVAHMHEWMAAASIPMLRQEHWPGALVFTTHATLLGRYLAMNDAAFYEHLPHFDDAQQARHFNIEPQHGFERAAAHGSHVFTTVSDVTAEECTHLLGRTPDVLVPNGLNIKRFAALHEFQNLHQHYKQRSTSSRWALLPQLHLRPRQHALLLHLRPLRVPQQGHGPVHRVARPAQLALKQAGTPVTVVFFIITKAPVKSINVRALESSAMLQEFRESPRHMTRPRSAIGSSEAAHGSMPDLNALVDEYWRLRLRRSIHAWRSSAPPSIVTHDLIDDARDPVLNQLRQCALFNHEHDPVKVVFHPSSSRHQPAVQAWSTTSSSAAATSASSPPTTSRGATHPLESIALGVPAITSDLSGFGSYLQQLVLDHESRGISVINRRTADFHRSADELTEKMFRFCQLSRRERINLRNATESFSEYFDWHNLGKKYHEAHELALQRIS